MQIQAVSELSALNVSGYQTTLKTTKNSLPAPTVLNGNTKLWIEISKLVDAAAGKYLSMKLLFSDFTKNVYDLFQAVNNKTVDIDKAISDLEGSSDEKYNTLLAKINALEQKVDSNKAELDREIANLKTRVNAVEKAINDNPGGLKARMTTVENAINDNPNGLKARMTTVENAINDNPNGLKARMTTVEGRATTLEGKVGDLETGLLGANLNIGNIIAGECTAYLRLANIPLTVQGSITFNLLINGMAKQAQWS